MTKDDEIGNKTSSTTGSAKNLPLDKAEDVEVDSKVMGVMIKWSKRSSSRKLSGLMDYLISLRSHADSVAFEKR